MEPRSVVYESPTAHAVSKYAGGVGITLIPSLLGGGLASSTTVSGAAGGASFSIQPGGQLILSVAQGTTIGIVLNPGLVGGGVLVVGNGIQVLHSTGANPPTGPSGGSNSGQSNVVGVHGEPTPVGVHGPGNVVKTVGSNSRGAFTDFEIRSAGGVLESRLQGSILSVDWTERSGMVFQLKQVQDAAGGAGAFNVIRGYATDVLAENIKNPGTSVDLPRRSARGLEGLGPPSWNRRASRRMSC